MLVYNKHLFPLPVRLNYP